jgi:hypothetical protein
MKTSPRAVRSTIAVSMLLSGIAIGPAAAAPPPFSIAVAGDATPYAYNGGVVDGTTVQIPVTVTCPPGIKGYLPFAGLPGYFSDGRFAAPYLPPNPPDPATYGGAIDCTGQPQAATTIARTIAANQDPLTNPYEYFTSGPATVTVTLVATPAISVSDTKAINILPPTSTVIEILTDTAILQSPYFKENIDVAYRYKCAPAFNGRIGRVSPVVSMANPTIRITCDDAWHSWSGGGIAAHVGTVDFSVDIAGRVATKTIQVTPPLPDAVSSMTLFDATSGTLTVAWTAPRPRESALGPMPDTTITGYKVGWLETGTGRSWQTDPPHWPLSISPVTLTGLVPNTAYDVWVIPVNVSGDGAATRLTSRTAAIPPPPPLPPPSPPPPVFEAPPPQLPIVSEPPPVARPTTPKAPEPKKVVDRRAASSIAISGSTRISRGSVSALIGQVSTLREGRYVRTDGLRIVLQRLVGNKWVNVGALTSRSTRSGRAVAHGMVQLNVRPLATAAYRWSFAGTATLAPCISRAITIRVIR